MVGDYVTIMWQNMIQLNPANRTSDVERIAVM